MLDDQQYLKATDAERAADNERAAAECSEALAVAGRKFERKAAEARARAAEPRYQGAESERLKERAATWDGRAAQAGRGSLLFTPGELHDAEFMGDNAPLINLARAAGRLADGPGT